MSHFTCIKTRMVESKHLVRALADVGLKQVEVHETAQHLYGYMGDRRSQTAEIIVRRQHLGRASNDLGFKRQADGTFDALISAYDRTRYSPEWLGRLAQRYAYHAARERLEEQGFALAAEETQKDGRIHLTLRRMA